MEPPNSQSIGDSSSAPSVTSSQSIPPLPPLSTPTVGSTQAMPNEAKRKRKVPLNKSKMWDHFTRCKLPNGESDIKNCSCNYCKKVVPCDPGKNGNSSMQYYSKKCKAHPLFQDANPTQTRLSKDNVSGGTGYRKWNKKKCDDWCIEMIIKDELPFRFVEKEAFVAFCKELEPNWIPLTRKQVAQDVLDRYHVEKALLISQLKASDTRVSITTYTWTSIQTINYMVVTAHFMDDDWKLHKRIINFCNITSHKGEDIGRVLEQCLRQWDINKVFTITVDNASANDVAVQYMMKRLTSYKTLMFNGEYLHLRCSCHIINIIVKDGLKELEDGISGIWNCVKYVRGSPQRLEKFREIAILEQATPNANIPLDVVTRWNNTFLMLEAALKYEVTFNRMAEDDEAFKSYFTGKVGPPTFGDWRNAEAFCGFFKKFYAATLKLSAWKTVTSNVLFVEMITLLCEIKKALLSEDQFMSRAATSMKAKFDKYWESFETTNKIIMIANVLDPRYKLTWSRMVMRKINASVAIIKSIEEDLRKILIRISSTRI